MTIMNNKYHNPISTIQIKTFIENTPAHLIHERIMHEHYKANKEHVFNLAHDDTKRKTPSILVSGIQTILLRLCRQITENKLGNFSFII